MMTSHSPRANSRHNKSGITLLEILAALALVGVVVAMGVGQISKMSGRNMRIEARKLASTIRYLYVKAVTDNRAMRLVFDFDERKYWAEETSDLFALKSQREVVEEKESEKKGDSKKEEASGTPSQEATFSASSSKFLKPQELSSGVYFKDIFAEHQLEPTTEGKAAIHFFPQGYVERSVINLRDKNDELHYSLEINPINGMATVDNKYKEVDLSE